MKEYTKVSEYEVEIKETTEKTETKNLGWLKDRKRILEKEIFNKRALIDQNLQAEIKRIQAETAGQNKKLFELCVEFQKELDAVSESIIEAEKAGVSTPPAELSVKVEGNKVSWEATNAEKVVVNGEVWPCKYEITVGGSVKVEAVGWDRNIVSEAAEVNSIWNEI
jgi:hypothetical protein